MPTRNEIIEAGAEALHDTQWSGDWGVANEYERTIFIGQAEAALAAMLPLLKQALAEELRGQVNRQKAFQDKDMLWRAVGLYKAARIIERYEL